MNKPAGTRVRLTKTLTVTIGKIVPVYAVYDAAPGRATSGAIPADESPTLGMVESAYLGGLPLAPWAKLRLISGRHNTNRRITVSACDVASS